MNYYVIADTHFGHNKMPELCGRPEDFSERILRNIANTVGISDVLIHLGDFCFYNEVEWHDRFMEACKGRTWLIKGNHDKKSTSWYLDHNWDFVADEVKMEMFGKVICLSHKPALYRTDFDVNVHGHLHNSEHRVYDIDVAKDRYRLITCEHSYTPISLRRLVEPKQ